MMPSVCRQRLFRSFFYGVGVLSLALGLTMSTQAGLGVGPVVTVPYTLSLHTGITLGTATFLVYLLYVLLQLLLDRGREALRTALQIPFSVVFGGLLDLLGAWVRFPVAVLWQRALLYAASLFFSAGGVALSLPMRLVNNPADGFARALGERTGRGTGAGKNLLDLCCVGLALLVQLVTGRSVGAIGVGTLVSAVATGRLLALFNRLFRRRMETLTGLRPEP